MIQLIHKRDCCGCSACSQVCPKRCIEMKIDEEGFMYPSINEMRCVECGLCESVCPVLNESEGNSDNVPKEPVAIGGWHKNEDVRYASSSGGAFSLFAEHVINQGGIVYGATMDEEMHTKHIGVKSVEDLSKLRGSKYVQSDINGVYADVKENMENGRKVLFVGTPCQAAGLYGFLGEKRTDNLYIADFICHGVPSPKVFESYIKYVECKYNSRVAGFKFRLKDKPWSSTGMQMGTQMEMGDSKIIRNYPAFRDAFMNGFLDDVYLRPSCYRCKFKSLTKYYSDITIADFWGVDKVDKELCDGKGTSLILLHSQVGQTLFEQTKENFFYKECSFAESIKRNKSLIKSVEWNSRREKFFKEYREKPFEKVMSKYMSPISWASHKACKILWKLLQEIIRKVITPILKVGHVTWNEEKWEAFFQFVKFAIVGVSNTLVSYLINVMTLMMLQRTAFEYDYMIANVAGFSLSVLWSYYWNNKLVFTLSQGEKRNPLKTLLKTYMAYGFSGFVLNNVLSTIWIQGFGFSKYIAPILNLPFSMPVNFLINKLWAYRGKRRAE